LLLLNSRATLVHLHAELDAAFPSKRDPITFAKA